MTRARPARSVRLLATSTTVLLAPALGAPTVSAVVTTFSSRAAFTGAAPGIPVDHFPSSISFQPYPNNFYFHTSPVSAAATDPVFPAGCFLPGLTIRAQNPVFASQAIKVEAGPSGLGIGAATFEDVLILDFSPPVAAVGADVLGHVYPGPGFPGQVEVTVYNGAAQLAYFVPSIPDTTPVFVGITSPTPNISRVTFLFTPSTDRDSCVFVRDVAFGTPGAPSCCAADFNCSGSPTVQDIFDFLGAWFAADPRADFNAVGGITVADIFDFLSGWFAGCP